MRQKKSQPSSNPLPADILLTLGELDIEITQVKGDEAWALCPAHKARMGRADHSASWSINLETGSHFCFSCGWKGPFIGLVRWQRNMEVSEAEAWIRKHGGIAVARKKLRGEVAYQKKKAEEVDESDLVFYYDPPDDALEDRDLELSSCQAYGVKYDYENDYWIIPIRDPETGRLLGWQEKGKGHFRNHPQHLEKAQTLFGYPLLGDTAYLEESPLDCVRLHTYSLDGAVSGYGVHVSEFQMELIVDRAKTLYVCLDNDDAGRAKEEEIWREYRHRTRLYFANYENTDKKDHGEMTPEEIEESLSKAVSALRFRPRANR